MAIEPEEMPKTVLLVEDSLGDVRLTLEAFKEDNQASNCMWFPMA
jgi:hypothetical protein